jgi:O-acetyl-ADP-ribose deacetylase (regulator of RNase III)
MSDQLKIKNSTLRLEKGDITDMEIESFVFYAENSLALGSGYGTAISIRGGPSVQEELDSLAPVDTTNAVVSAAGNMKAQYIVHAVGPKFQEEDMDGKLRDTILNTLRVAEEKGIKKIAFPAMGAGFYGVPLPDSAKITLDTIREYLGNETRLEEVVVCLMDNRQYKPFQEKMATLS